MTPQRLFDVDVRIIPPPPTATKSLCFVFTIKEVIVSVLLSFPAESVTIIVQSEYVLSLKVKKVTVLSPLVADAVPDEQVSPYEIVPASDDEKV